MEALGRMAAIIIAIILLILFPIRYEAQKTDISIDTYIETEVNHFYHSMIERHELTQEMYERLCDRLSVTGFSFRIEIEGYQSTISVDETNQYLEYEDLLYQLNSEKVVVLKQDDYILVRVQKQNKSVVDRVKNLFLPTAITHSIYKVGGRIE